MARLVAMGGGPDEESLQGPVVGQPLPGAERAVIDREKLVSYALDLDSPRGQHKASVFRAALGIEKDDVDYLMNSILDELPNQPVTGVRPPQNPYEAYTWEVLVPIDGIGAQKGRRLRVVTAWEMKGEGPHLVTTRVAPKKRQRSS